MLEIDGIAGLVLLGLWLFAIFDVIATDSAVCRNLPKGLWLLLVIILPDVGAIAWLLLGRPQGTRYSPGSTDYRTTRAPVGIEDSNEWATRSRELDRRLDEWEAQQQRSEERRKADDLAAWETELRRREEDLRRREEGLDPDGTEH